MGKVDFSYAKLDVNVSKTPLVDANCMNLGVSNTLYDSAGNSVVTNQSVTTIFVSGSRKTLLFKGTFTTSGSECYTYNQTWKISNIYFVRDDTYSFAIDIEAKGNV